MNIELEDTKDFRGLVGILRLGGPILTRNFEIFEKICAYLVNPKILGGPWPPWPPHQRGHCKDLNFNITNDKIFNFNSYLTVVGMEFLFRQTYFSKNKPFQENVFVHQVLKSPNSWDNHLKAPCRIA